MKGLLDPVLEPISTIKPSKRKAKEFELRQTLSQPIETELAILFHNTYEKLAPNFGYKTRKDTKVFDPISNNGRLMIAVCKEILSSPLVSDKLNVKLKK